MAACGADSGTTGSLALVRGSDLVIANVGDSSVLLVSSSGFGRGRIKYMSPVHRPTDENEATRIRETGGKVVQGFVVDAEIKNGLAVSRTLGDRDMQQYGFTSEPDIRRFTLSNEDTAIIFASDGFWDHDGVELRDVLKATVRRQCRTPTKVCQRLLEMARQHGPPMDDCTIACRTIN